jgi:hypothetical protein
MLLGIPDDKTSLETVLSYFAKDTDIIIEEVMKEDYHA